MIKKEDKRGFELAFSTLVGLVLAITLLVLLLVFITGGFGNLKDKIFVYLSASNIDNIVQACNSFVLSGSSYEFCCVNRTMKVSSKEKYDFTCIKAINSNKTWAKNIAILDCEGAC